MVDCLLFRLDLAIEAGQQRFPSGIEVVVAAKPHSKGEADGVFCLVGEVLLLHLFGTGELGVPHALVGAEAGVVVLDQREVRVRVEELDVVQVEVEGVRIRQQFQENRQRSVGGSISGRVDYQSPLAALVVHRVAEEGLLLDPESRVVGDDHPVELQGGHGFLSGRDASSMLGAMPDLGEERVEAVQ
jgi:hypothetical protein